MTEKRKKIFIMIIIATLLISIGGVFIFFTHQPKTEKKEQVKKTSTLESYEQYRHRILMNHSHQILPGNRL